MKDSFKTNNWLEIIEELLYPPALWKLTPLHKTSISEEQHQEMTENIFWNSLESSGFAAFMANIFNLSEQKMRTNK